MQSVATWWGYTEGSPALVTGAVALLVTVAIAIVARRALQGRRR